MLFIFFIRAWRDFYVANLVRQVCIYCAFVGSFSEWNIQRRFFTNHVNFSKFLTTLASPWCRYILSSFSSFSFIILFFASIMEFNSRLISFKCWSIYLMRFRPWIYLGRTERDRQLGWIIPCCSRQGHHRRALIFYLRYHSSLSRILSSWASSLQRDVHIGRELGRPSFLCILDYFIP